MNRIIKFRIWNKKTKSWLHGPDKNPSLDGVNLFGENILLGGFCQGVSIEDLNESVALQYTGIEDKNGVQIYEGDIIEYTQCLFNTIPDKFPQKQKVIEWDDYGARWNIFSSAAGELNLKVIGNIFENPELLNP